MGQMNDPPRAVASPEPPAELALPHQRFLDAIGRCPDFDSERGCWRDFTCKFLHEKPNGRLVVTAGFKVAQEAEREAARAPSLPYRREQLFSPDTERDRSVDPILLRGNDVSDLTEGPSLIFHLLSDLHLEFTNSQLILDEAEPEHLFLMPPPVPRDRLVTNGVLLLAGDLTDPLDDERYDRFVQLLQWASPLYHTVAFVAGNHDICFGEYTEAIEAMQRAADESGDNVHFLNRTVLEINDRVTLLGCTFWTNVPDEAKGMVSGLIEYSHGLHQGQRLTVENTSDFHSQDREFLVQNLNRIRQNQSERKVIILTHHTPLNKGTSDPIFELPDRLMNHGFSTDLSQSFLLEFADVIDVWAFGHTHYSNAQMYCVKRGEEEEDGEEGEEEKILMISNQVGYFAQALTDPSKERYDGGNWHTRFRKGLSFVL